MKKIINFAVRPSRYGSHYSMKTGLFTIPNAITCLNLISGCLAVSAAFYGNPAHAFLYIMAAAVFDFLDGFAARMLKSYSEAGKQLDSLADMVSFGVAPPAMLLALPVMDGAGWWKYAVFVMAAFSALRLAKFNIDERQTSEFIGLPTPANAILTASICFLAAKGGSPVEEWITGSQWTVFAWTAAMSLLLVSEIRMFSFKFASFGFRGNELRYAFIAYAAIAAAVFGLGAIPLVIATYIVVSMVRNFY